MANMLLQESARQLRSLRLMKLSVQPDCLSNEDLYESVGDDEESEEMSEEMSELVLDKWCRLAKGEAKVAADHIFASLADSCPQLVAISFDINDTMGAAIESAGFCARGRPTFTAERLGRHTQLTRGRSSTTSHAQMFFDNSTTTIFSNTTEWQSLFSFTARHNSHASKSGICTFSVGPECHSCEVAQHEHTIQPPEQP